MSRSRADGVTKFGERHHVEQPFLDLLTGRVRVTPLLQQVEEATA